MAPTLPACRWVCSSTAWPSTKWISVRAADPASSSATPPAPITPTSSSYGARAPSPNARAVATTSAPSVHARQASRSVWQDARTRSSHGSVGQRPRAPGQDLVGHGGQQHLLAREVVVDGTRLHAQLGAEPAHRQVGQPVVVEDAQCPGDDVVAAVAHVMLPSSRPR